MAEKLTQVKKEPQGPPGKNQHRAKKKPPKGMHLSQGDVAAMSTSTPAAVGVLKQIDMELVAIKRQVSVSLNINTLIFSVIGFSCSPLMRVSFASIMY